jgi:hypothetical protein
MQVSGVRFQERKKQILTPKERAMLLSIPPNRATLAGVSLLRKSCKHLPLSSLSVLSVKSVVKTLLHPLLNTAFTAQR